MWRGRAHGCIGQGTRCGYVLQLWLSDKGIEKSHALCFSDGPDFLSIKRVATNISFENKMELRVTFSTPIAWSPLHFLEKSHKLGSKCPCSQNHSLLQGPANLSLTDQIVHIFSVVGHIHTFLSRFLFFFVCSVLFFTALSVQTIQKQVVSQIWPSFTDLC